MPMLAVTATVVDALSGMSKKYLRMGWDRLGLGLGLGLRRLDLRLEATLQNVRRKSWGEGGISKWTFRHVLRRSVGLH